VIVFVFLLDKQTSVYIDQLICVVDLMKENTN